MKDGPYVAELLLEFSLLADEVNNINDSKMKCYIYYVYGFEPNCGRSRASSLGMSEINRADDWRYD
jgi:hypothetical protein